MSLYSTVSQITLVNPEPTVELVLSTKSVLNTFLLRGGVPAIAISTVDPAAAVTKITDLATKQLVATIKRKTFLSDVVIFEQRYNGEPLKIKQWLQEVKTSGESTKWVVNTPAGTFVWHLHKVFRLALCPEDDPENPVAWLQLGESFGLVLKRTVEGFRDEIIASFVILEQQLRLKEKEMKRAEGWSDYNRSATLS